MNGTYADLAGQAGLAVVERFVELLRMPTHLLNWCLFRSVPATASRSAAIARCACGHVRGQFCLVSGHVDARTGFFADMPYSVAS